MTTSSWTGLKTAILLISIKMGRFQVYCLLVVLTVLLATDVEGKRRRRRSRTSSKDDNSDSSSSSGSSNGKKDKKESDKDSDSGSLFGSLLDVESSSGGASTIGRLNSGAIIGIVTGVIGVGICMRYIPLREQM